MSTGKVQAAVTAPLPATPEGFVWRLFEDATFLKPRLWCEHEQVTATSIIPVTTYATLPEVFCETKPFDLGLTVQVTRDSQKLCGVEAKKIVLVYLRPFVNARKEGDILFLERRTKGDFEYTFFRYTEALPSQKPVILHKFILANNVTDRAYAFTFKSPTQSWGEHWAQYGAPMLSQMAIGMEIVVPAACNHIH